MPSATGVAEEQPVGDQQDQGATDGGAPGGGVEELVVDGAVEELGGEPAAEEGAHDADDGRADQTARVTAGEKELGDGSGEKPEDDPAHDAHGAVLAFRCAGCRAGLPVWLLYRAVGGKPHAGGVRGTARTRP